jgi:hypothetical protein
MKKLLGVALAEGREMTPTTTKLGNRTEDSPWWSNDC